MAAFSRIRDFIDKRLQSLRTLDKKNEQIGEENVFTRIWNDYKEKEKEYLKTLSPLLKKQYEELEISYQEIKNKNETLAKLSKNLSKYLSPQVYRSIFSGEKAVRVESSRKMLTVFFSDIKDFTPLTESLAPETLTALLNNYLNEMSKIALRHGGTIDKFVGDAIIIFFGDPTSQGKREDALACVKMALEMREKMRSLQQQWYAQGIVTPLQIRMGINTGYCTVGNFGSEKRLDYTVIGHAVNIASRLESIAEPDQILISDKTHVMVKDHIACEQKGETHVKGIMHSIQTFQVTNVHKNLSPNERTLEESGSGYSLMIDFAQLKSPEIPHLLELLESTIHRLKQHSASSSNKPPQSPP